MKKDNIVFIGMAGAGKSTIGRAVAQKTGRPFVDTDDLIAEAVGKPLQRIIDEDGVAYFRMREEEVLVRLRLSGHVIATGGSAIYSDAAMKHLRDNGQIVLLKVSLEELMVRVMDMDTRGLVKSPRQGFAELFEERRPLYDRWADIVVDCTGLSVEQITGSVLQSFQLEEVKRKAG